MRQRIVGAVVLVVLAVILLPLMLNFDGDYVVNQRSQIPASPDIVPVKIDQPQARADLEDTKNAEQMFNFDASREQAEKNEGGQVDLQEQSPALTAEGMPESWILQIASFVDPDKANSLKEKLLADQYHAFSKRSVVDGKTIYRVYVGPKILKKDMLDDKAAIDRKYKIKTLLLRFEP
ncbi:MAG: hypothetical protein DRR42_00885 [Gammaproteobacteria bacterium]|nr:MAG: hypothetical protein DRR42_00885 [Gammaproteobacteria bacterium]